MIMIPSTLLAVSFIAATVSAFITTAPTTIVHRHSDRCNSIPSQSQLKMASEGALDVSAYMAGPTPEGTEDFIMQQTMFRVKDPKKSLDFYCNVLGFKLVHYSEYPEWKFNVYFVAPVSSSTVQPTESGRWNHCMNTPGCVELTWNYGSEKEEADKIYNTGNADATGTNDGEKIRGGFGHIGITVPNVYKACERFHEMGAEFHKSPNAGGMKGLAFVKDPDGYLIEILPQGEMVAEPMDCLGVPAEGGEGYKDNSK
mmetsp:Transcript_23793/g.37446  ORF Transcript_23793/g.37446 Transcript_23793/m.37446 type:complete len:256 (+) Transcript_23793:68-835(+)